MTVAQRIHRRLPDWVEPAWRQVRAARDAIRIVRAERALRRADTQPEFLGSEWLPKLDAIQPRRPRYSYRADVVAQRGRDRAQEILGMPGAGSAERFLEVGCWDGMLAHALSDAGKSVAAVDIRTGGIDDRARATVGFSLGDVSRLPFGDETIDFVASYDTFEHFPRPDEALAEMTRVLRPGGHLYMQFGPLYLSAWGEHAYRSIEIPYCQLLFDGDDLNRFCRANGRKEIDFGHVNRWRLDDYRELLAGTEDVRPVLYREHRDPSHLHLVRRFPACFRSVTEDLDDLTVDSIEVLLVRQGTRTSRGAWRHRHPETTAPGAAPPSPSRLSGRATAGGSSRRP